MNARRIVSAVPKPAPEGDGVEAVGGALEPSPRRLHAHTRRIDDVWRADGLRA